MSTWPDADSWTVTRLARVCRGRSTLTWDTSVGALPVGTSLTHPAPAGLVAVTLRTAATAPTGTPPRPATCTRIVRPSRRSKPNGGYPVCSNGLVSTTRTGISGSNDDALAGRAIGASGAAAAPSRSISPRRGSAAPAASTPRRVSRGPRPGGTTTPSSGGVHDIGPVGQEPVVR